MTIEALRARTGESARINRRAQRELVHYESTGAYKAARKARAAAADAARALDALLDELEKAIEQQSERDEGAVRRPTEGGN